LTGLPSIAFPETIESFAVAGTYSLEHPAIEAIDERALKAPLSAHAWGTSTMSIPEAGKVSKVEEQLAEKPLLPSKESKVGETPYME
jgi:hypothetical protein